MTSVTKVKPATVKKTRYEECLMFIGMVYGDNQEREERRSAMGVLGFVKRDLDALDRLEGVL